MAGYAFADLEVGRRYDCGSQSASAEEIVAFAEQFDPLRIHTDPEWAESGPFGGLVASGIHTFGLSQAAAVEGFFGGSGLVASVGIEALRFPAPLRPDDRLDVTVTVEGTRVSERDPERGVVTTRREGVVDGESVIEFTNHTVWTRTDG